MKPNDKDGSIPVDDEQSPSGDALIEELFSIADKAINLVMAYSEDQSEEAHYLKLRLNVLRGK